MAQIRIFRCYRRLKRAFTRKSKYKKKGYVKAVPGHKIIKFNMGNTKNREKFEYRVECKSKGTLQIRHNAIEASRQVLNRKLQKELGNIGFYLMLRKYPHHAVRENKMLGGAHADRIQSGMAHSYGKVTTVAVQIREGESLFTGYVNKNGLPTIQKAFKSISSKLPCKLKVEIIKNN